VVVVVVVVGGMLMGVVEGCRGGGLGCRGRGGF
jgi:hypothetical protein